MYEPKLGRNHRVSFSCFNIPPLGVDVKFKFSLDPAADGMEQSIRDDSRERSSDEDNDMIDPEGSNNGFNSFLHNTFGSMIDLDAKSAAEFASELEVIGSDAKTLNKKVMKLRRLSRQGSFASPLRKESLESGTSHVEEMSDLYRQMLAKKNAQISVLSRRENLLIEKYRVALDEKTQQLEAAERRLIEIETQALTAAEEEMLSVAAKGNVRLKRPFRAVITRVKEIRSHLREVRADVGKAAALHSHDVTSTIKRIAKVLNDGNPVFLDETPPPPPVVEKLHVSIASLCAPSREGFLRLSTALGETATDNSLETVIEKAVKIVTQNALAPASKEKFMRLSKALGCDASDMPIDEIIERALELLARDIKEAADYVEVPPSSPRLPVVTYKTEETKMTTHRTTQYYVEDVDHMTIGQLEVSLQRSPPVQGIMASPRPGMASPRGIRKINALPRRESPLRREYIDSPRREIALRAPVSVTPVPVVEPAPTNAAGWWWLAYDNKIEALMGKPMKNGKVMKPGVKPSLAAKVELVQSELKEVYVPEHHAAILEAARTRAVACEKESVKMTMRSVVARVKERRQAEELHEMYKADARLVFCHTCGKGPFPLLRTWRCDGCYTRLVRPPPPLYVAPPSSFKRISDKKLSPSEEKFAFFFARLEARRRRREQELADNRARNFRERELVYQHIVEVLVAVNCSPDPKRARCLEPIALGKPKVLVLTSLMGPYYNPPPQRKPPSRVGAYRVGTMRLRPISPIGDQLLHAPNDAKGSWTSPRLHQEAERNRLGRTMVLGRKLESRQTQKNVKSYSSTLLPPSLAVRF